MLGTCGKPHLIACTAEASSRNTVVQCAAREREITFCASPSDLALCAARGAPTTVFWELGASTAPEITTLATALASLDRQPAVLVRVNLARIAAQHVLTIAKHCPWITVSVDERDHLVTGLRTVLAGVGERTAYSTIADCFASRTPDIGTDLVLNSVVAGNQRLSVRSFASICGYSVRAVEWRCKAAMLPTPERLLRWVLTLHSLWRIDVLRWTLKRAAAEAGFASEQAWSAYICRCLCAPPTVALKNGGFSQALAHWAGSVVVAGGTELAGRLCRDVAMRAP